MKRLTLALLVAALSLSAVVGQAEGLRGLLSGLFPKKAYTVGADIACGDITDFYYTYDSSAFPPAYQRYRVYLQDGAPFFYHETRAGDHWPLTEADATASGTIALTEDQWAALRACLEGGTVKRRDDDVTTGGAGPWMFLYWKGDRGDIQAFSFASYADQAAFEALCAGLRDGDPSNGDPSNK